MPAIEDNPEFCRICGMRNEHVAELRLALQVAAERQDFSDLIEENLHEQLAELRASGQDPKLLKQIEELQAQTRAVGVLNRELEALVQRWAEKYDRLRFGTAEEKRRELST